MSYLTGTWKDQLEELRKEKLVDILLAPSVIYRLIDEHPQFLNLVEKILEKEVSEATQEVLDYPQSIG